MKSIVGQFSKMEDVFVGEGVSEDAVLQAETKLGLKFSDDYKSYLRAYGIAAVNGHELTGLGASSRVNVVNATEETRKRFDELPEDLYVIENDNIDGTYYWQNKSGRIYRSVNQSTPKVIASSLIEFIKL